MSVVLYTPSALLAAAKRLSMQVKRVLSQDAVGKLAERLAFLPGRASISGAASVRVTRPAVGERLAVAASLLSIIDRAAKQLPDKSCAVHLGRLRGHLGCLEELWQQEAVEQHRLSAGGSPEGRLLMLFELESMHSRAIRDATGRLLAPEQADAKSAAILKSVGSMMSLALDGGQPEFPRTASHVQSIIKDALQFL